MRPIKKIIIHCSATKDGQNFDAADITRWHKQRGFLTIGYHFVIKLDGTVEIGRPISEVGAHTKGHNFDSIGICYIGGLDDDAQPYDTRTPEQVKALQKLVQHLLTIYPKAKVYGHNHFTKKACPCFNVDKLFDK